MCPIRNENKLKDLSEVNILTTTQRGTQTVHEGVMETYREKPEEAVSSGQS